VANVSFGRIVRSTWGASFCQARLLYNSTVRPALAFGASVWSSSGGGPSLVEKQGSLVQNRCLRGITGGYKATPIRELETEAAIAPFDVYTREACAGAVRRTFDSPTGRFIRNQCRGVAIKLWRRNKRRGPQPLCSEVLAGRERWARERVATLGEGKKAVESEWRKAWEASRWRRKWYSVAGHDGPGTWPLKLHAGLFKAQSSVLVQLRTGVNGFGHTLSRLRVPEAEAWCSCGQGVETGEHVLLRCSREDRRRTWARGTTFQDLVTNPLRAGDTTRWLIESERLGQFNLAKRILFKSE
jgi:hypothetical protein